MSHTQLERTINTVFLPIIKQSKLIKVQIILALLAYTKFSEFNNDSIRTIIDKLFLKALKLVHLRILNPLCPNDVI